MSALAGSVRAVVFDAYGTLFDVNAAAAQAKDALGERWQAVADTWRSKQLQYTWLRSLAGVHADFWRVTGDALDYALDAQGISDPGLRARLLASYERLAAYPDARETLVALKQAKLKLAVLSNGAPRMLAAAATSAGLSDLLDAVLSVEDVGVYKPHPSVYRLAPDRLGLWPNEIVFVTANGWDAWGAKSFGFRVAWCNRACAPKERLPHAPDAEVRSLSELPGLLGI